MKRLKYFILLLFIFSIFGSVFAQNRDYDLWYKEHKWLMLKQEERDWKSLKTEQAKEDFIEKFYTARDPDAFTYKNEFKLSYSNNLEKARKDYSDFDDPRRYIYLLFGEPNSKRFFPEQIITIPSFSISIRIGQGEIWSYDFGRQRFQVIFAKTSSFHLQLMRDKQEQGQEEDRLSFSVYDSQYDILYIGPERYATISAFLESFFQENFRLKSTSDVINDLKKQVLDRAENFYKKPKPEVQKKKYSNEWKNGTQVFINQFDIKAPEEAGIVIWILFDRDSLNCDSKKKRYFAEISLYCEIRDASNNQIVHYCDDSVNYNQKQPKAYYHFWGSLPAGKYKLILELGDNTGNKYKRIEQDINIFDFSLPGLKADLLIGKIAEDPEIVKGKPGYLSLKEGKFCLAFSAERFRDDDEMIVVLDISGFQKNLYGNPCLEVALLFIKGDIQQGEFVPSNEVFSYGFLPIEKDGDRFQSVIKIKIKDLVTSLKLPSACYQIKLRLQDKISNEGGTKDYPYMILILSVTAIKNKLNTSIKRMD